jgi:F420-dependent oxidoreductase-like protein
MAKLERLSFKVKPESTTWPALEAMCREAEDVEHYDGVWLYDHLCPIYEDQSGPCFEGWTALSYLAGITKRLRLGLMVSAVPYRNPGLLAKMATTFDHFSGGRLDLGLGAGWVESEAASYGMPLLPIGARLTQFEEACEILRLLFTQDTTDYSGKHYTMVGARCEPKPIQKPYPPILMGGAGEKRFLKIVARYADDWNYAGGTPEDFKHKLEVLAGHCETVGRNFAEIRPSCHIFVTDSPTAAADEAARYVEAGVRHVCVYFQDNDSVSLVAPTAEAISEAVASV